ncbi:DNA polymerase IV [bacterium]|nr:DNA polymerase IV [bacterium]
MRTIAHIDMDAFFASVEQLDFPELRGKPVVVGGNPFKGRGVVSSASYEARKYGIRSAMSSKRAYRLCPHAIFIKPRFARYEQMFWHIAKIMLKFTPAVELASIDEAYIDLTGTERLWGDPVKTAMKIKRAILDKTGLVASVGVAPNKMLAKMASESGKPDGFVVIRPEDVRKFLDPLPVDAIPGVGEKFTENLSKLGIRKIGDVLNFSENVLISIFGKAGSFLYYAALGQDDRPVKMEHTRKSISHESTFDEDIEDIDELRRKLLTICDHIAERMLKERMLGRTITLKIRQWDFYTSTRSTTLAIPTRSNKIIFKNAYSLLKKLPRAPIRLLGVSISHLIPSGENPEELFRTSLPEDEKLMKAISEIREKYGTLCIRRGFEIE